MASRGAVGGVGFIDAKEVGNEEDEANKFGKGDAGHAG